MKSTTNRSAILCISALLGSLSLCFTAGCGSKDESAGAKPPVSQDKQIEKIQNDTQMPQQAKDAAIAAVKSHSGGADAPKGDTTAK